MRRVPIFGADTRSEGRGRTPPLLVMMATGTSQGNLQGPKPRRGFGEAAQRPSRARPPRSGGDARPFRCSGIRLPASLALGPVLTAVPDTGDVLGEVAAIAEGAPSPAHRAIMLEGLACLQADDTPPPLVRVVSGCGGQRAVGRGQRIVHLRHDPRLYRMCMPEDEARRPAGRKAGWRLIQHGAEKELGQ